MALVNPPPFYAARSLHDGPVPETDVSMSSPLDGKVHASHLENVPVTTRDPRIDDTPQLQAKTEWYYLQAHLRDASSDPSSDPSDTIIVCIFRQQSDAELDPTQEHTWAVIYAHLDWKTQKYTTHSKVPPNMPKYALKSLEENQSLLSKTIRNMINSGPKGGDSPAFAPDGIFTQNVQIRPSAGEGSPALCLDWDNGASLSGENGSYHLKVPEIDLDIQVNSIKPVLLHGDNGVTLSSDKICAMFYYSYPRSETLGEFRGKKVAGTSWMDHEYSLGDSNEAPKAVSYGWRWFSLLTSGGPNNNTMEICITQVTDVDGIVDQYIVYLDETGQRQSEKAFTISTTKSWVSGHTFQRFDTGLRLLVPSLNVDMEIEAVADDQEFQTWIRMPSFYEGAVRFSGTWKGAPIRGFGLMELVHETDWSEKFMDQTLINASTVVRGEAETWVPSSVRPNHFLDITKVPFDSDEESVIQENIVDAFYMLNNRGGKNWRPMLFGAAVGLVSGNANDWRSFLVIPELVHTASLIIDDIEDESEARRGGPCVHKMLGVPTSINAGCAIYFWGETIIRDNEMLTDRKRKEIYSMYFEMMRVGHVGQALDIAGMSMHKLPSIPEAEAMLARVVNLHRCKSGIPASFGGLVGALVGGGTPEQISAIGAYVQNLGIAFQIRDDVLDVLGKVKGKNAADDLYNHKITYPVAKLFALDHPDREKWFSYWQARDVPALVEALKSSGTMDTCNDDIHRIVGEGWDLVDSLTPNSFSKVLFRMFAHYLVEQHY